MNHFSILQNFHFILLLFSYPFITLFHLFIVTFHFSISLFLYLLFLVRHRLAYFEAHKGRCPITMVKFNPMGNMMFYAMSYDWCKGVEFNDPKVWMCVCVCVCVCTCTCVWVWTCVRVFMYECAHGFSQIILLFRFWSWFFSKWFLYY